MRGISFRRAKSVYDLLGELAQHLSASAEIMSRTLGEDPSERALLAQSLERESADAAALHRRVTNTLATSLITPFEADALHELSHAIQHTVEGIERTVAMAVQLKLGTFRTPLMETLALIERMSELTVQACWTLSDSDGLASYYEEMRRVETHASTLARQATVHCLLNATDPGLALREREVVWRTELVLERYAEIAKAADLLRVKDS